MPKYVLLRKIGSDVSVTADRHEESSRHLNLYKNGELVGKFETSNYSGWYVDQEEDAPVASPAAFESR